MGPVDTCVACGAELGVGRFCLNCGHRIGAPAPVRRRAATGPVTAGRSPTVTATAPARERPAPADDVRREASDPAAGSAADATADSAADSLADPTGDDGPEPGADRPAAPVVPPVVPPVQAADPTPVPPTSPPDVVPDEAGPPPSPRPTWDPHEDLLPYEEVDDVDGDLPVHGLAWLGWVLGAALLVGLAFLLLQVFDTDGDEVATDPAAGATDTSQAPDPGAGQSAGTADPTDDGGETPAGAGKALDLARGAAFEVPGTAPPTTDFDGNLVAYEASQMGDGNPATAWRTAGDATGETVTVTLTEPGVVTRVGLVNGYAKQVAGVDWYPNNRRVLSVTWGFDDGSSIDQTFVEQPAMQRLKVPPVQTSDGHHHDHRRDPAGPRQPRSRLHRDQRGERHRAASRLSTTAARSASARETSRWVTRRTVRGPTAAMRTPSAVARSTNDAASGRSTTTMLVSMPSGSSPRASPSSRALAWSSASRSTWWSRAYAPAAASTPT